MAQERQRTRGGRQDSFDTSLMYDDIERIREREEEVEKNETSKLAFAGMMMLVAGVGLILVTSILGLGGDLAELLTAGLSVVGFGALGYGFYKTIKLVFRKKELSFPTLNVYRKTKPKARTAKTADASSRTRERSSRRRQRETQGESRAYRKRQRHTQGYRKKNLSRSRMDKVFSGVAGGIAEYTGVSASLIRFALVFGTFVTAGFPIIFLYLLLSIVLPPESSWEDEQIISGQEREIKIK